MNNLEMIKAIDNNYPSENYTQLREALDKSKELLYRDLPDSRQAEFDEDSIECGSCGSNVNALDGYAFCPYCGQRLVD